MRTVEQRVLGSNSVHEWMAVCWKVLKPHNNTSIAHMIRVCHKLMSRKFLDIFGFNICHFSSLQVKLKLVDVLALILLMPNLNWIKRMSSHLTYEWAWVTGPQPHCHRVLFSARHQPNSYTHEVVMNLLHCGK